MEIKVENLTKNYGPQKAIDGVNFKVETGEILGFLGPNGAGKTTALKILTNYMAANDGDVYIGGKSIKEHGEEIKKHIGYLPENTPLYMDMPVIDYLKFSGRLQGVPKEKIEERVREMIRVTGLDKEKHKTIDQLSKGFRQRTGLAQALIHDPEILLLDEPTTGLDPNQIIEIRELIKRLGKHKTVILSTHILPEVEATSDRILIINEGQIVADGTPDTLREQAQGNEILSAKIEDADVNEIFNTLQKLPTAEAVDFINKEENTFKIQSKPQNSSKREVFKACVENNWTLTELIPQETRLEDIFRNLTMK